MYRPVDSVRYNLGLSSMQGSRLDALIGGSKKIAPKAENVKKRINKSIYSQVAVLGLPPKKR